MQEVASIYTTATSYPHINGSYKGKDILSFDQFTANDLHILFPLVAKMKQLVINHESSRLLDGLVISLLFFEPSSRTFSSFASAVKRLGAQTLELQNPEVVSSVYKGETFEDTIRVFEAYSDAIVLRHPRAGAARLAAEMAETVPIVNAGDGNNEHPTQTLLDLYTLYETFGRLTHLKGLLVGDLLNSRTLHSLMRGLSLFEGNTVYLLAPERLQLPRAELTRYSARGLTLVEITSEREIPKDCDFWYWTRIQKERLSTHEATQPIQPFVATQYLLDTHARRDTILMDPLPRVGTIETAVDSDPRAVYLRSQIRNGLYTRMALLARLFGRA